MCDIFALRGFHKNILRWRFIFLTTDLEKYDMIGYKKMYLNCIYYLYVGMRINFQSRIYIIAFQPLPNINFISIDLLIVSVIIFVENAQKFAIIIVFLPCI